MMSQVFPVPRAFNRQPRRRWRAEPYRAVTGCRSKVGVPCAQTGRRCQSSEPFCDPSLCDRTDKIARLRHAVVNGDYCVSPEHIAEKMAREALVAMFT